MAQQQQVTTVTTVVPVVTFEGLPRQMEKLAERDSDLGAFAANGWVLTHTHAITGTDHTMFVDTLARSE